MSITITHQDISIDVNNSVPQQVQCIANVNDSGTRYVDVTLYANGSALTISSSCTATATFVTDGVLVSDEIDCTISNSVITVPLQDFSSISGVMLCEINITYYDEVIVTPFAFIVRVTPTLASNAQISNKSYGTTAEILQEVAEARGDYDSLSESISTQISTLSESISTQISTLSDSITEELALKEVKSNKCSLIYSSDETDSDTTNKYKNQYPTVYAVRAYVANQIAATLASEDLTVDLSGIESNISTISDSLDGKEDVSNKETETITDVDSSDKYPSDKAIASYLDDNYLSKDTSLSLFGLGASAAFDKNYVPLTIISSDTLSLNANSGLNSEEIAYIFISKNVCVIAPDTFSTNVTDIYIDRPESEVVFTLAEQYGNLLISDTFPSSATVHYREDLCNADEFLLKAIYNLSESLDEKEDVSNKVTAITNSSEDKYPSNKAVKTYLSSNYFNQTRTKELFGLTVSAAFDENYIPLKITDSTTLSAGSLNVTGAKYAFVANDVASLQDGTFSSTITDIYVDQSSTSSVVYSATTYAPDGATVYDESGLLNADEFLLRAIYNLYNTLKVSEITSDNSSSKEYYPSNKAVANYVDTAITNFENTWDFESLCSDVDNLSSNVDGLESDINTLTSKVTSINNMIYFKQGTSAWDGDIYIYFYNNSCEDFYNRIEAREYPGVKMILIDEENGIYAYPRLNYTHVIFTSSNVDSDSGWNYKTSGLILPLQTQEKMPCFYQSPIAYDGIWGDLVTDTVRIYLQTKYTDISVCLTDTGEYITPYPLGIAGTGIGQAVYYSYVDLPSNFEGIEITWTVGTGSSDYIVTTYSREELCYNHTVVYCTGSSSECIGYFNGDLDEFFRELIGYDNSKLS